LRKTASVLGRRGMVVAISDFYDEDASLKEVRRLSRMGHDVVVVHVLAREELTGLRGSAIEIEDLETGATIVTNADAIASKYEENVATFVRGVEESTTREGVDYLRLVTGEPLEPALRRFLVGRRGGE
jgi:hypothetical protein